MRNSVQRFLSVALLLAAGSVVAVACTAQPAAPATTKPAAPAATSAPAPAATKAPAAATTAPAATAAPTKPAATVSPAASPAAAAGGASTLTAVKTAAAPNIDADPSDADWAKAQAVNVRASGGANLPGGSTDVSLKALYTTDTVFFLAQWADPTQSFRRYPWVKQPDGSWKQDIDTTNGDSLKNYEDKMAFIWNIDNSIKNFETQGCFVTCHLGEGKPFGNKYTSAPGERGDIWHLKTVRTGSVGQIDDQWVDDTRYDKDKSPEAGRKSDPNTGGGYKDNATQDKKLPAFGAPDNKPAPPYWIKDAEKVAFDDSKYKAGDEVPGIVVAPYQGDRGDLTAAQSWKDGKWTVEWSRKLQTGGQTDVQFNDLSKGYYFGVAVFDDAQVRHAYQSGATQLRFAQ